MKHESVNKPMETKKDDSELPEGYEVLKLQRWRSANCNDIHTVPVTPTGEVALRNALELTSQRPVGRPGSVLALNDSWAETVLCCLHLRFHRTGRPVDAAMVREAISALLNNSLEKFSTDKGGPAKRLNVSNEEKAGGI